MVCEHSSEIRLSCYAFFNICIYANKNVLLAVHVRPCSLAEPFWIKFRGVVPYDPETRRFTLSYDTPPLVKNIAVYISLDFHSCLSLLFFCLSNLLFAGDNAVFLLLQTGLHVQTVANFLVMMYSGYKGGAIFTVHLHTCMYANKKNMGRHVRQLICLLVHFHDTNLNPDPGLNSFREVVFSDLESSSFNLIQKYPHLVTSTAGFMVLVLIGSTALFFLFFCTLSSFFWGRQQNAWCKPAPLMCPHIHCCCSCCGVRFLSFDSGSRKLKATEISTSQKANLWPQLKLNNWTSEI